MKSQTLILVWNTTKENKMSKVAQLAYDIEQMYIEGYSPPTISVVLECPVSFVYEWLDENGILESDTGENDYA